MELQNLSKSGDIVSDNDTGLQWQDDVAAKTTYLSWQDAIDYCEDMSINE